MAKRKSLGKKVRFEVFKRDSFKCQYCGATAPDVVLQVDHIKPVAEGGTDEMVNLITSCQPCNSGKGARELSDDSAVAKQRRQLEDLQARREQLEMMLEWHGHVSDLRTREAEAASEHFGETFGWWYQKPDHMKRWKSLIRRFGLQEVMAAIEDGHESYAQIQVTGDSTQDSAHRAYTKLDGICKMRKLERDDPEKAEFLHMKNTANLRCSGWPPKHFLGWLEAAKSWGATMDELWALVRRADSWGFISDEIDEFIRMRRAVEGEDRE